MPCFSSFLVCEIMDYIENHQHTENITLSRAIKQPENLMCAHIFSSSGCHSDNEEDRASRNGRQETVEFKDEEETVTTKSIQITQATETTTTTTRKRSGAASSKTLDLGAAAHYTGDKSPEDKVATGFGLKCYTWFLLFSHV